MSGITISAAYKPLTLSASSADVSKMSGGVTFVIPLIHLFSFGAGEAIRTPDPNLGKVMLYP